MFSALFGRATPFVVWQRRRNRELPIEVLGRLGWTVKEIGGALGVTPPTVRDSVAYLELLQNGKFGRSNTPWPTKLPATVRELARRENVFFPSEENDRVVDALRNVLANVPRLSPAL